MYAVLLALHIAAGSVALLSAVSALIVAKGKTAHRRWGMAYVCSMALISLTAWTMSALKPNAFLFAVGCFSAYLVASGYARAKNRSGTATALDWTVSAFGLMTAFVMLWLGSISAGTNHVVLLVFAGIAGVLAVTEIQGLRKNKFKGTERIVNHMRHMMAGTIATVTALAVVNIRGVQPGWLVWIAPSILITPLIIYWAIRLRRPLHINL
ncbi:MAG: hypothetical protein QM533_05670 [Cytophagales bacterium]|nr:hypothetical protein [Cytophagales bacterium]